MLCSFGLLFTGCIQKFQVEESLVYPEVKEERILAFSPFLAKDPTLGVYQESIPRFLSVELLSIRRVRLDSSSLIFSNRKQLLEAYEKIPRSKNKALENGQELEKRSPEPSELSGEKEKKLEDKKEEENILSSLKNNSQDHSKKNNKENNEDRNKDKKEEENILSSLKNNSQDYSEKNSKENNEDRKEEPQEEEIPEKSPREILEELYQKKQEEDQKIESYLTYYAENRRGVSSYLGVDLTVPLDIQTRTARLSIREEWIELPENLDFSQNFEIREALEGIFFSKEAEESKEESNMQETDQKKVPKENTESPVEVGIEKEAEENIESPVEIDKEDKEIEEESYKDLPIDLLVLGFIEKIGITFRIELLLYEVHGNQFLYRQTWEIPQERLSFAFEEEVGKIALSLKEELTQFPKREVEIETQPSSAIVFLDGEEIGESKLRTKISTGYHQLEIIKSQYQSLTVPLFFPEENLEQADSKETKLYFELEPLYRNRVGEGYLENQKEIDSVQKEQKEQKEDGTISKDLFPLDSFLNSSMLRIESEPSSAEVYLDLEYQGRTPLILESLVEGEYKIHLEKEGYLHSYADVTVKERENLRVFFELEQGKTVYQKVEDLSRSYNIVKNIFFYSTLVSLGGMVYAIFQRDRYEDRVTEQLKQDTIDFSRYQSDLSRFTQFRTIQYVTIGTTLTFLVLTILFHVLELHQQDIEVGPTEASLLQEKRYYHAATRHATWWDSEVKMGLDLSLKF